MTGPLSSRDQAGAELQDDAEARREAMRMLPDIARAAAMRGGEIIISTVRDENGREIGRAALTIEWQYFQAAGSVTGRRSSSVLPGMAHPIWPSLPPDRALAASVRSLCNYGCTSSAAARPRTAAHPTGPRQIGRRGAGAAVQACGLAPRRS